MTQANPTGGDMPQYDNTWGLTTRLKDNEACERSDDLEEGGYAPVCNSRGQQLDQKWMKPVEGPMLSEREYASVCNDEQTEMQNASKLLYSEICSSII